MQRPGSAHLVLVLAILALVEVAPPGIALGHPAPPAVNLPRDSARSVLAAFFPNSRRVTYQWIDVADRKALGRQLGATVRSRRLALYVATGSGGIDGYAFVTRPGAFGSSAQFAVKIAPDGRIAEVRVMRLSDPVEAGVLDRRFLRQFRGRRAGSSLRLGGAIREPHHCGAACRAAVTSARLALWLAASQRAGLPD